MSKSYNQVVNTPHALEQCKRVLDKWFTEKTITDGEVFHFFLKPFQAPKTYKQLGAIRILCDQISKTEVNEYAGHDSDYWYRYYKLRAYIPQLETDALESNDAEIVALISSARQLIKSMRGASLFNFDFEKVVHSHSDYLKKSLAYQFKRPANKRLSIDDTFEHATDDFIKNCNKSELGKADDGYTAADFIADNPAFSYSEASKKHLIGVIDYIQKDAARKGIYVELKKGIEQCQ